MSNQSKKDSYEKFNEKIQLILALLEKDYLEGDQYSAWIAIYYCFWLGCSFPDWLRMELAGAAVSIIDVEPKKDYPKHICNALKLNGHKRKSRDTKQRDSTITQKCIEAMQKGMRRKDIVNDLSQNNEPHINVRQVEAIYDSIKKRNIDKTKLNMVGNKVTICYRNFHFFDERWEG